MNKERDVKYGSRVGDLVLLEVVIETSPGSSGRRNEKFVNTQLTAHKFNNKIIIL